MVLVHVWMTCDFRLIYLRTLLVIKNYLCESYLWVLLECYVWSILVSFPCVFYGCYVWNLVSYFDGDLLFNLSWNSQVGVFWMFICKFFICDFWIKNQPLYIDKHSFVFQNTWTKVKNLGSKENMVAIGKGCRKPKWQKQKRALSTHCSRT